MGSTDERRMSAHARLLRVLVIPLWALVAVTPITARAQSPANPTRLAEPTPRPIAPPREWKPGDYFPPSLGPWPHVEVTPLLRAVDPDSLRRWHDLLASEPHVAGSPGDLRQADRIAHAFQDMGLEVEKHEIHVYLSRPDVAILELIEPATDAAPETRKPLILKEHILPEDADSGNPDLSWGWNAYSGSGDITAEVVYANHGTKADFAKLRDLGVDLRGKIVLCRYGGNFRGHKVRFAEAAQAAGVVIFTDGPDGKVPTYPGGGAPNDSCIERGSVTTLDYPGDPLTPGVEATKDAPRIATDRVALPTIPVQPIGWGAAREILIRMAAADDTNAPSPPLPAAWQCRIPVPNRIVGGPALKLRLKVQQTREIVRTYNVIGTLTGETMPEKAVLVGSHHDAWGFGACDPCAGTICTMEAARVFAEAAGAGRRPRRTMKFCAWAAEEFGIIGSTEWVEANHAKLTNDAVAYINLDMSAMGPNFGSSAAPALKTVITEAARSVPAVGSTLDEHGGVIGPSVFDTWIAREPDPRLPGQPRFGDLGGGSDHVAFWCHAGVPSASLGSGGTPGSAYHSVYDTLAWYRSNVGDDYRPARMVTQMVVATLARLANDVHPPLDHARTFADLAQRSETLANLAAEQSPGVSAEVAELTPMFSECARAVLRSWHARGTDGRQLADTVTPDVFRSGSPFSSFFAYAADGLPSRNWYRNDIASPDADSGYAAWILPRLTLALERRDPIAAKAALEHYRSLADRLTAGILPTIDSSSIVRPAAKKPETGH